MSSRRSTTCCRSPICSCRCSRWAVCCSVWRANTTPAPASSSAASKTSPNGYWTASATSASASRPSTPLPLEPAKSVSLIPLDQWAGGGVPANVQTGEHLPKAPLNWRGNIIPSPYALALTNRPWPSQSVGGGTIPRRCGTQSRLSADVTACIVCGMLIRSTALALLILYGAPTTFADVLQLKDKAAIAGKILAEKRDQVIVDLGYTVLAVPRNQIIRIVKGESLDRDANKASTAVAVAPAEDKPGIFQSAGTTAAERSVRELVSQLGEAVVQVRTPGGLGSGF